MAPLPRAEERRIPLDPAQPASSTVRLLYNPGRGHKRQTATAEEQQQPLTSLRQPFSETDFSFDKTADGELLFVFDVVQPQGDQTAAELITPRCIPPSPSPLPPHEMYINLSPLSRFSSVLVPFRREHRPQVGWEERHQGENGITLTAVLSQHSISRSTPCASGWPWRSASARRGCASATTRTAAAPQSTTCISSFGSRGARFQPSWRRWTFWRRPTPAA